MIIDQAFGCITSYIRSRSIHTVQELLAAIKTVLSGTKKYQGKAIIRLHHLFDFKDFFEKSHTGLGGFHTQVSFRETATTTSIFLWTTTIRQ